MTGGEWQRIKQVMGDALDQPDTKSRLEFLSAACEGDQVLRSEIDALLAHANDRLDVVAERMTTVRIRDGATAVGQRLGDYELVREIGRGGMGTIYLARRADEEFEKEVAIKVLKRGTDTEEVLRRFRAERQILAQLEHPNIARLIDAGTNPDGLPYFVMEFVDGVPVTDFCDAAKLDVRERLALFQKICGALHFAHQNLVVHRDLKPGNILITPNREPKLLDFGIAKLLSPGGDFLQATIQSEQRFTPAYASPEQIRGDAVTTASDVYSLGALLYHLLAGEPPHRFATSRPSAAELFKVITEREPARVNSIPREVDTIVRRALSKEPQRRYSGAAALAEDISRYLEGRPVRARPATHAYRALKFIGRNRVAVTAAMVVLLAIVAGAAAYIFETRRTAFHAQQEAAHFHDLRKLANLFVFKYHDGIAGLPGSTELRKELVKDALEYLNNLSRTGTDDPDLLRELGSAYKRIADVQGGILANKKTGGTVSNANLGDTAGALENYGKALTIREKLARIQPDNMDVQAELAGIHNDLGIINIELGKPADASEHLRRAIRMFRSLADRMPTNKLVLDELRASYWWLASALAVLSSNLGDTKGALEAMQSGVVIAESLLAQEPLNAAYRQNLAIGYGDTGRVCFNDGRLAEALQYYRKALAIGEGLVREDPTSPFARRELAVQHRNVGSALLEGGDKGEALNHFRQAIALFEQLVKEDPNDARIRRSAAYGYRDLGEALAANREPAEAEKNFNIALGIFEDMAAKNPRNGILISQQALTHLKLSRFFLSIGDVPRAQTSAELSFTVTQEITARDGKDINARKTLAEVYAQLGHCAAATASKGPKLARAAFQQSAHIWRELRDKGTFNRVDARKLDGVESEIVRCDAILALQE